MKRVAILLSILIAVAPSCALQAQTSVSSGQGTSSSEQSSKKRTVGSAQTMTISGQPSRVSLKIGETDRITLRNRFGPIVVTGIGGDTLEATASVMKQGTGSYKLSLSASRPSPDKIMITTAVSISGQAQGEKTEGKGEGKGVGVGQGTGASASTAPRAAKQQIPKPAQPAQPAPSQPQPTPTGARGAGRTPRIPRPPIAETPPSNALRGVGDIRLEVKLPRNAHIDLIDSRRYAIGMASPGVPAYLTNTRNDVSVTNMETPISVISSGDVQAAKVGGIEARTRAANVYVRDIAGPVSVTTVTGTIVIKDADGDVRAVSISGPISIECARGRTEAGTTNGTITLTGIGGDLDATTTGGAITFMGEIRDGGRYRLKSMSGIVRMLIQKEPPGFLTNLSSYKGAILLDFELKTELSANTATSDLPSTQGQPVRRMAGRYGNGNARITLDSFSGSVQLAHAPSEDLKKCR